MLFRILCLSFALVVAGCQSGPSSRAAAPASSSSSYSGADGGSIAALAYAAPEAQRDPRYAAIVVDADSGRVLFEENADATRYPASLAKMMTLYLLFEELERGRFNLNSPLAVSPGAAARPPSKIGLRAGETIRVEDAIRALAVKSANDVAATVAENIAGSEAAFAARMTETARGLGMTRTAFRNASGLPDPGQVTTARDMARLADALQDRFPRYYSYFSLRSFSYGGRTYESTNRLLGRVAGMDGIKTGYIRASGYNLATSVRRDGRRINVVLMGGVSGRARDEEVSALVAEHFPASTGWFASR